MEKYELIPKDNCKSFYGKCYVIKDDEGNETLYSYDTPIITRTSNGEYERLYDDWTYTTGRHIKAFCDMNKKEFNSVPLKKEGED